MHPSPTDRPSSECRSPVVGPPAADRCSVDCRNVVDRQDASKRRTDDLHLSCHGSAVGRLMTCGWSAADRWTTRRASAEHAHVAHEAGPTTRRSRAELMTGQVSGWRVVLRRLVVAGSWRGCGDGVEDRPGSGTGQGSGEPSGHKLLTRSVVAEPALRQDIGTKLRALGETDTRA